MMACVTGALLAVDFASAAAHFSAGFCGLRALALSIQNRAGYGMHGGYVNFDAENGFGELLRANDLTLHIQYFNSRHCLRPPSR